MKDFRKSLALIVSLVLIFILAVGCSGKKDPVVSPAASDKAISDSTTAPVDTKAAGGFKKFDPPIDITTEMAVRDSDKLLNGDTPENNPLSRWARDTMGINVKYKWIMSDQNSAMDQKLRLALASNEELPDVIGVGDQVLTKELIDSGKIMPIDEAFEKYATPRTKEAFKKNPDAWAQVIKDGKKWGLPQISDGYVGDTIMWIRQDWLDAVGKKAPTNIQELEDVLAAFKQKYPSKYPMALAGKNSLISWMADSQPLFGKNQMTVWDKDENGKLFWGSVQPGVKAALVKLNEFYKKGYIDKEFGTYDEPKASALFTSGDAGLIFSPAWAGGWPLGDTLKNVSGSVVKAYPIPSGVDGTTGRRGSPISYGAYFFRKGFEHMDAIFWYWDQMIGKELQDVKSPFANGFAEGYDYTMVDNKPVWKDAPAIKAGMEIGRYRLLGPGNTPPHMLEGPSIFQRVLDGKRDTPYEQQLADSASPMVLQGTATLLNQRGFEHPDLFLGRLSDATAAKKIILDKQETDTFLKIVYGKVSPDEFDKFVANWKAKGGDEATAEVNAWYSSVH